jgi:glutamine synthetase
MNTEEKLIAEYIWVGGSGELRSKARTLSCYKDWTPETLPHWDYDGSSTGQAPGNNSEVIIVPRAVFWCPFREGRNILVMCDTYNSNGVPLDNNYRNPANELFNKNLESEPWYGIEQEFFMIDPNTGKPLGFTEKSNPQGQYYCSVGCDNAFGRDLLEQHYNYCLWAGINISGINAEVAPGQWEYQVGPVEGISAGDHLYVSRYILYRLAEKYNIKIEIEPKPLKGDWNGSGCHINYSTKQMREGFFNKTGLEIINEAVEKLSKKHDEHMQVYGTGNELRMTGLHETAKFDEFTFGVANRGASVRIPNVTFKNKRGYLEDRRPSSNIDPYRATGILFKTTVID